MSSNNPTTTPLDPQSAEFKALETIARYESFGDPCVHDQDRSMLKNPTVAKGVEIENRLFQMGLIELFAEGADGYSGRWFIVLTDKGLAVFNDEQTSADDAEDHTVDLTPTHCPSCGCDLDIQTQVFPTKSVEIYTCWNDACSVYGRTATARDLCDLAELWKWNAMLRFDPVSGIAIPLYITYSNTEVGTPWAWERRAMKCHGRRKAVR